MVGGGGGVTMLDSGKNPAGTWLAQWRLLVPCKHSGSKTQPVPHTLAEFRSCVKVEVAVLGSLPVPNSPYGFRGLKATLKSSAHCDCR